MILFFDPAFREVRTWNQCEIEGLFFVLTIKCMKTGDIGRAAILSDAYELRAYLQTVKGVIIHNVQMMCPPTISGQEQWLLEEIDTIAIHTGIDRKESAVVYRTKTARYKLGDLDLRKKKTSRLIYSKANLLDYEAEPDGLADTPPRLYGNLWK